MTARLTHIEIAFFSRESVANVALRFGRTPDAVKSAWRRAKAKNRLPKVSRRAAARDRAC